MEIKIIEILDKEEKKAISKEVLNDLPEWFGLSESTQKYISDSQNKPFVAAYVNDEPVGFIVLNETSKDCADIFVMGIKKKFHRMGVGSMLNETYEAIARKLGYTYSQVKTVQFGHYKEYDISNKFYIAMGYKELECFPTLWDEWNPCQIFVKYLGA